MGNVSYRLPLKTVSFFICSQLQRHWPALSALVSHSITRYSIHNFLMFLLSYRLFFVEEQERVQKKTFTNWINSYLSKVSSLSIQCSSIYLSMYVSIYRISIDSPLKFAYQHVRHYFFHSFANWRQCGAWPWSGYRIANILNVDEVHEIVN